jgi:hypothetical protein
MYLLKYNHMNQPLCHLHMDELSENTKQTFFLLLDGELPIKDFENWVFNHSNNLEKELRADFFVELIRFGYDHKDSLSQLKMKIKLFLNRDEFIICRTKKLLTDIIENRIDLVLATHRLRWLYDVTGETFIPVTLGAGYQSELDDVPIPSQYSMWEEKALQEKLKKVDQYKEYIIRDAKEFLDTLNKNENNRTY